MSSFKHGLSAYKTNRCRCGICAAANLEYERKQTVVRRKRFTNVQDPHDTYTLGEMKAIRQMEGT